MSTKRCKVFRAGVESLERRETPSGIAAAAVLSHVAARHAESAAIRKGATNTKTGSETSLLSGGYGIVTQSDPDVNGHTVTTTFVGRSKAFGGHYTAVISIFYDRGKEPVGTGSGTITAANGDTLTVEAKSRALIPYFSTNPTGKLEFNIVDGTGNYVTATGRGAFVGYVNYTNSFTYELRGHLTT